MSEFPPGPDIPVEELHKEYFLNTFPFLLDCFEQYGDVFTLSLGDFGVNEYQANGKWVFLTKSEDIETLFKADKSVVFGGQANQIQFHKLVPALSSTACDADEHLKKRRLLLKFFKNVTEYTEIMQRDAKEVVGAFPTDEPFSLYEYLKQITFYTIFDVTMGDFGDKKSKEMCQRLIELEKADTSLDDKRALISSVQTFLLKKIRSDRNSHEGNLVEKSKNVYEHLLLSKEAEDYVLTAEEVADEIVSLLMGGISTTAIMLSWAFSFVLSDNDVYQKIQQELDEQLKSEAVNQSNVDRLEYLSSVILETLRIQPFMATPGLRLLKQDYEFGEYLLPQGTLVANCSYLLQRRPEYYADPETFCPARFSEGEVSAYQWTPFGGGIRRCVGYAFALHGMKVMMATIMQNFNLELAMPVDGAEFLGAFFGPKGGPLVKGRAI